MSLSTLDLPRLMQEDLKACLESDPEFTDVTVLCEDSGRVSYYQALAVACMTPKAGKIGLCAVIAEPTGKKRDPGVRFGPYDFDFGVWILEYREDNIGSSGTGKSAFNLARWASTILEGYAAGGLAQTFFNFQIKPENLSIMAGDGKEQIAGFTGWKLTFKGPEGDYQQPTQVAAPVISPREGAVPQTVTLTCSTAGASIYYTTDLSHPWSGNATATLYSAPITISAACVLSARAFKSGSIGSIRTAANYT